LHIYLLSKNYHLDDKNHQKALMSHAVNVVRQKKLKYRPTMHILKVLFKTIYGKNSANT